MFTSKVIYEVPEIEKQISLFKYFLELDEKFKNTLYLEYPQLKSQELSIVVNSIYDSRRKELEYQVEASQHGWNKIEEEIIKEFTKILHKDWSLETIPAGISLLSFSTRDLKEKRFNVYYKKDIKGILKTTTHELFHFIYFDKWLDIFPNTTIEEMDYPNPVWALSEIVLPIMLNNSEVKNILGTEFNNYPMFENEEFEGEKLVLHIENLYKGNELENFLKKSSDYFLRYYELRNRSKE